MSNNLNELRTLFGYNKVKKEPYLIALSQQKATMINETNPETAEKLILSGALSEYDDETGGKYWAITVPKKGGLDVAETFQLQSSISSEMIEEYQLISEKLLRSGYKEEEINELVFMPVNHSKLPSELRTQAFLIYKKAVLGQNKELADVTGIIANRVVSNWELSDTLALPESLFEEFKEFLRKEKEGWDDEEEMTTPKSSETIITTVVDERQALPAETTI